ncbi:MAG: hypothetical protein JNL08_13410 [Planctomycetes bacterium]|nr:hypothetical protein [Planctomycetota bacterium]
MKSLTPRWRWLRWSFAALVPALLLAILLCFRTGDGLAGVHLTVATGIPEAESSRAVAQVARVSAAAGATIDDVTTVGPAEAVAEVRAGRVPFCIVPIGCAPALDGLHLVARLPVHVPFLLIGPRGRDVNRLVELAGKRIAIGPDGSATSTVGKRLLGGPELAALDVVLVPGSLQEGLLRLRAGEVDFVALLASIESPLVRAAVDQHNDLVSFAESEALQDLVPFARAGTVSASRIDIARGIPGGDRRVLEFPLGVLCGEAARRSEVVEFLRLLQRSFPGLVAANQAGEEEAAAPMHDLAASYFAAGGAGFVDVHLPVVHDWMPWSRFAQIVLVVGFVFELFDRLRRFRLGRLVAEFRRLGAAVAAAAGVAGVEVPLRIAERIPANVTALASVDELIGGYEGLHGRARRLAESWLAPMEGDPSARAIELLSMEWVLSLRAARERLAAVAAG